MPVNKVEYFGNTLLDLTGDNVTPGDVKKGVVFHDATGAQQIGTAEVGSGTPTPAKENDVMFLDYDGTILYSYTAEEAMALTAMPPLPSHPGLVCQGWNWSYENMHSYVDNYGKCIIGATYITDDGKTRIYITLPEGRTSPMLGCAPNGTVTVDWGDGTTPDVLTGTSTEIAKWTPTHNYASGGDYVIALTVNGEMGFVGDAENLLPFFTYSHAYGDRSEAYHSAIKKMEIGSGVTSIRFTAIAGCRSLSSVVIPNSVTSIGTIAFSGCSSLPSVVIPDSVTSIGESAFSGCAFLSSASIPDSVTSIEAGAFSWCSVLSSVAIPDSVTSIEAGAFSGCYSLPSVAIPDSVTSIGESAFGECFLLPGVVIPNSVEFIGAFAFGLCAALAKIRFEGATPPVVDWYDAWEGIPSDCIVSVPVGSLSAYTNATNYLDPTFYTYVEEA